MRMWKDEGWRGFMKGNGINVVRVSFVLVFQLSPSFLDDKLIAWTDDRYYRTRLYNLQ